MVSSDDRTTLRSERPHWIYMDSSLENLIDELIVTPNTVSTLSELGRRGIIHCVLLSTSPLPEEAAVMHRTEIARRIDMYDLLDALTVALIIKKERVNS